MSLKQRIAELERKLNTKVEVRPIVLGWPGDGGMVEVNGKLVPYEEYKARCEAEGNPILELGWPERRVDEAENGEERGKFVGGTN